MFPAESRQMNPPAPKVINGADASPARATGISHEQLLLRTLIDNLPDCIYAKDVRKLVTAVNMKYGSPFLAACRGLPGIVAGSTPPWSG